MIRLQVSVAANWWAVDDVSRRTLELEDGATVGDAARAVAPDLACACLRNGAPTELGQVLEDGDSLQIVLVPGAPGLVTNAGLLKLVGIFALSYVVGKLTAPNLDPRKQEDDSSPTYGWNGIRTVYRPLGLPYPMILGEHWTGGYAIQRFVENELGPERRSWLHLLIAVSLGPVRSVGGILADADELEASALRQVRINGNLATNYTGITAWVRLGRLQQEVISPFASIRSVLDVGLPVDQVTEESGDTPVTDWSLAVAIETGECERGRLAVRFPRGLYDFTTGELAYERAELQVRYARIDSDGQKISDWASAYDGEDATFQIVEAHQGSFTSDLVLDFFDPETVAPPAPGIANHFDGTTHYALTAQRLQGNPSWAPGAVFDGTIVWRGQIYAIRTANPIYGWSEWNGLFGDGSMVLTGFQVGLRGDLGIGRSWFFVYWGNGSSAVQGTGWDYYEGKDNPTLDDLIKRDVPVQLTLTVEHNAFPQSSKPHRIRLFIDDVLFGERKTAVSMVCPTSGRFHAGSWVTKTADGNYCADLDFDELEVWRKVFLAPDVAAKHAQGAWTVPDSSDPDLVAYWSFSLEQFPYVPDETANGNDLDWPGINQPSAIPGWTYFPASGTRIRSRYRVEVQRIDVVRDGTQVADACEVESLTTIEDDALGHPGLALLGLRILASEQLSGSEPDVQILVRGRADLPRWDGRSEDRPTFSRLYSRSPSDQLALVATDVLEGAGNYYKANMIDWPAFRGWEDFCARLVYDQHGTYHAKTLAKVSASSVGLHDFDYPDGLFALTFRERVRNYDQTVTFRVDSVEDTDYPVGDFVAVHAYVAGDQSFVLLAAWPAGLPAPAVNPYSSTTAAQTWRTRPQLQSDLVLGDRNVRFWGVVQILCAVGRATPVRIGEKLSVVWQDSRQPVAVFNASNIDPASFRASARRRQDQPNVLSAEFQDAEQQNARSVATRAHPSLAAASSTALRVTQTVDMRGATERHQVRRELDYQLARAQSENLELEFRTLLDAIFLAVGDVALITYPLPSWAWGGTVETSSASGTELTIDVPLELEAGTTYFAAVIQRSSQQVAYVEVASPAGSYAAGAVLRLVNALPFSPSLGDLWAVGTQTTATGAFQLVGRAWEPSTHYVRTRWLAYSDAVYPAADHGVEEAEADVWSGSPESGSPATGGEDLELEQLGGEAAAVRVSELAVRDRQGGAQRVDLQVTWDPPTRAPARWLVWAVAEGSPAQLLGEVRGARSGAVLPASQLRRGLRYRIAVQAVASDGSVRGLEGAPSSYVTVRALYAPPPAPLAVRAVGAGEGVRVEVDLPEGAAGCSVEIRRGGAFVGVPLGSIPPGATVLAATLDWAPGQLEARLVSPSGVRSLPAQTTIAHEPAGSSIAGDLDYSGSAWTGPGGTLYSEALDELEVGGDGALHFDPGSSSSSGSFEGWEQDLGTAKRVHVAHVLEGLQVPSTTLEGIAALYLADQGAAAWTGEGSLDPAHPAYEAPGLLVEIASSATADPGSTWQTFVPGMYYLRSARFRLTLTRASVAGDILVSAFRALFRELP